MVDRRLRVLMMIDEATVGGGQQHVLWLAERLALQGHTVAVACEGRGYLVDELAKRGLQVFPVRMSNTLNPRAIWQCARAIHLFRPDIVHTHGGTAGLVGRLACVVARVQGVVHTYHGIHYLHYKPSLRRTLHRAADRFLLRRTDRVVCVAQADHDIGVRAGVVDPSKAVVIRNGIDASRFSGVGERANPDDAPVIGTIGRLHVQKGHAYLLEAAKLVLARVPSARFEIIGDGELRRALERQAKVLGVGDRVAFMGSRIDVPALLAGMSVFVLPSLWEGLPLVLLEAMAARKPIVATSVDGACEIITHGVDGLLVSPGDPAALAEAIIQVLQDPVLAGRLASSAFKTLSERFNVDVMVSRVAGVYQSLVL